MISCCSSLSRVLRVIDRLGPAAGIFVVALALVAAGLVPLGWWRPALVLPLAGALAFGAWRLTRGLGPRTHPSETERRRGVQALVLAVAFTIWSAVLHSGHVVIRRDGGAYALYTQWISTRHGLPVAADLQAFGGEAAFEVTRFTLSSPAFYQVLSTPDGPVVGAAAAAAGADLQAQIVPQFLVGAPAVYSLGWWAGAPFGAAWTGMQVVPALMTGLALLCFAALVGRLVGPGWAPLGVAGLGLVLPVVLVSRTTYSEPVALLVLLGAAVILLDALVGARRDLAVLGGALVGLTGLVRVDAVREVALLAVVCAVLAVRANRVAIAIAVSALAGSALSLGIGWAMSRPYLTAIGPSLRPLLAVTLAVVAAMLVAVPLARRRAVRRAEPAVAPDVSRSRGSGAWPRLATGAVLLLGVVLVSRPLWLTVRQDPDDTGSLFVASLQRGRGDPVDGGRTYAEHSLEWVAWYLGWPAVVGAWVVVAVLAGRAAAWWRSRSPDPPLWVMPAVVGFGSTVLVLLRPGITPDHPWADRRLVPVLLPFMVAAVVGGIAWASRHLPQRRPSWTPRAVGGVGTALLLVPVLWASVPLAATRTEAGEVDAVQQVCDSLQRRDVVVAVDSTPDGRAQRSANEWVQVVRGICGRPAGALLTPAAQLPDAAASLAGLVAAAGGRLVLLTAQEDGAAAQRVLAAAGAGHSGARFDPPRRVVATVTSEDRKQLTTPPASAARLVIDVWTAPAR